MIKPPVWTEDQLEKGRNAAIEVFRKRRMEEPLEEYLEAFDAYQSVIEELLESTVDLRELDSQLIDVVTDKNQLEVLRYLPGPPISADDLKTLADAVLTPSKLRANPLMAKSIAQIILNGIDRRRFPWVTEGREPTEAERSAAVLASAALLATSRAGTKRRTEDKDQQETEVMEMLAAAGLRRVSTRDIPVLSAAPGRGEFCAESRLGTRKADIVLGLWDGRVMPIECKVSNSSTNSVKRLNNDAAVKAVSWKSDFGTVQVIPAAVLSGVYKLHNLQDAQARGLTIFWSHDIAELIGWIASTK
ncbi:XamI family restriction endonuclease [Variovorax sp. EL159]|uniref:XamI family restriction endonuclease n=1 Tax=Variovorax sp. EL159 TaxID=1566270 RepID=UPI00087F1622|nr:XamI family restriction endonuclease [Variovorax sp. EL159]SCX72642.1 XamI restriction endonuclease [Variovorax sp. EL159]